MGRLGLMHTMVEALPGAVVVVADDDRTVIVNARAERLFGYPVGELTGQPLERLLPERARTGHVARRRDGSELPVDVSKSSVQLDRERLTIVGVVDLGARVEAGSAAERALDDFAAAQRIAATGSWSQEPAADNRTWSAEMFHILGRDPRAGAPDEDGLLGYLHPEDRERVGLAWRAMLEAGTAFELDCRTSPAHGAERVLNLRGSRDHERPGCYVGIVQDVTERRAMESELRASQAELRHQRDLLDRVVDNAPTGTALVAPDGTWLRCNAALAGIVGYSEAELLGSTFQDITHPDDLDVDLGYVRQMLDGEIRTYQMEKRYIHKDGRIVWIRLSVSLVRDDRGEPMLFISQIEDITAWKDHAAELETRVRERTVELEAVNRELESFSYSVSHDLRGPLRAIDGFGKALTTMHRDELSADAVHKLDRIRAAAQRMGELIDELLVLAGLTRRAMHLEHVDLSELAREIVEALRSREPTRSVVVEVEDGMECEGDSTLLRTVVENLLGNAWKFTSDTEDARIRFGVERVAGREEYVVSDNGAGFDMAHGEKLFAPFERLHRQDEFPGTGVGLTSVERIVRRHGGTITAHGEVGAGASIRFTINSRRTGVR